MAKLKGYALLGLALLLCPCHLPLLLVLVGGTAAGALLRDYLPIAFLAAGAAFVAALLSGLRLLEQRGPALLAGVLRSPTVVIDGRLRTQGQLEPAPLRHGLGEALREGAVATSPVEDAHA